MDQIKTGELIRKLRMKSGLTQKQLAEKINVSDKAVSKWECGNGCPDISLLTALSDVFGTDTSVLLSGEINTNETEKGNMKKLKFYVCSDCGNIVTAAAEAAVTCCGKKLAPLEPRKADSKDKLNVSDTGGELYITADHEMTKDHYISFLAYVNDSSVMIFRQYPEWTMQATLPVFRSGRLVWYCSKCGLLYQDLEKKNRTE